ncbi:unnamed protein product [Fraxinus pennsylvanica]|uniref:cysteine dioxygenase n=1 Tax=Fraxinus pennsylvanica TaxID=56036 RepID=A0AAD2A8H0_9LAMI|nr:unnamed protein product [Fraxinus pennsylvanica]
MGIEQNGSGGKVKGRNESKRNKRRQKKLSPVQKMYETCQEIFAYCEPGVVPAPEKIEKLAACLDTMTQADVGLKPNMPFLDDKRAPAITYLHLHECEKFSMQTSAEVKQAICVGTSVVEVRKFAGLGYLNYDHKRIISHYLLLLLFRFTPGIFLLSTSVGDGRNSGVRTVSNTASPLVPL